MNAWASTGTTPRGTLAPLSPWATVVLVVSPSPPTVDDVEPGCGDVVVVDGGWVTCVMPPSGGGRVVEVVLDDAGSVVVVVELGAAVVEVVLAAVVDVVVLGSRGSASPAEANA